MPAHFHALGTGPWAWETGITIAGCWESWVLVVLGRILSVLGFVGTLVAGFQAFHQCVAALELHLPLEAPGVAVRHLGPGSPGLPRLFLLRVHLGGECVPVWYSLQCIALFLPGCIQGPVKQAGDGDLRMVGKRNAPACVVHQCIEPAVHLDGAALVHAALAQHRQDGANLLTGAFHEHRVDLPPATLHIIGGIAEQFVEIGHEGLLQVLVCLFQGVDALHGETEGKHALQGLVCTFHLRLEVRVRVAPQLNAQLGAGIGELGHGILGRVRLTLLVVHEHRAPVGPDGEGDAVGAKYLLHQLVVAVQRLLGLQPQAEQEPRGVIDADMQGALPQSLDPDVGGCIHLQALPEVLAPGLGRVDPYPAQVFRLKGREHLGALPVQLLFLLPHPSEELLQFLACLLLALHREDAFTKHPLAQAGRGYGDALVFIQEPGQFREVAS